MRLLRLCNRIIEYGIYALFAVTPLLFNLSRTLPSSELFEWNKMAFVYGLTIIITTAWICRMIMTRKLLIKRTPFDIPLLLFLFSQILATVFSIDRHVSIYGYYSRFHGGLLSTVSYVLLYYAFVSNRDLLVFSRLLLFTFSSVVVVIFYGVLEKFGIDAHLWVQDVQNRVFSTFGQPNWLAAYIAVILPLFIHKIIQHVPKQKITLKSIPAHREILLFSVLAILSYICLLFTKSRSGFLGFWLADVLIWAGVFYFAKKAGMQSSIKRLFIFFHILLVICNFVIRTPFAQYNRFATVDLFNAAPAPIETPSFSDTVIQVGVTDSADIRRIVWQGAIDIVRDYPLFGTGPETFAFAYYKYRPAAHNLTSEWELLYNRAHNEFLNIAATSGLFGLGTYLLLLATVILWTFKKIWTSGNFEKQHLLIALLAAYISILVTNFFGFSVVVIALFLFLIPALILYQTTALPAAPSLPPLTFPRNLALLLVGIGGIYFLCIPIRFWIADSFYAQAIQDKRRDALETSREYIKQALRLRPDEPLYHDERADIASLLASSYWEQGDATHAGELISEAVAESTSALKTSPQNVNFWKTRTRVFFLLSTVDDAFTEEALKNILIAQDLAPTDVKIAYNVAVIQGRLGQNAEAIKTLEHAVELKPDYRDAYMALALFYEDAGNTQKARETLELILTRINPDDQEVKEKLDNLPL